MFIINPYRFTPPTAYLLDTYTGATAAYSLRILKTSMASLYPIRVRRTVAGVTAQADVKFNSLDTISLDSLVVIASGTSAASTLGEFVAASGYTDVDGLGSPQSAFVSVFYDQSGNGYNLLQPNTVFQPRIVLNGVIDSTNGHPSILFTYTSPADASHFSVASMPTTATTDVTMFVVARETINTTAGLTAFGIGDTASNVRQVWTVGNANSIGFSYISGTGTTISLATTTPVLNEYAWYGRVRSDGFTQFNATNVTATSLGSVSTSATAMAATFNANGINMSRRHSNATATNWWYGYITEAILFMSDQSANRSAIQLNQVNYY